MAGLRILPCTGAPVNPTRTFGTRNPVACSSGTECSKSGGVVVRTFGQGSKARRLAEEVQFEHFGLSRNFRARFGRAVDSTGVQLPKKSAMSEIRDGGSFMNRSVGKFLNNVGISAVVLIGLGFLNGDAAMANFVPIRFPWEKADEQVEPSRGTCATCIGVVDETLGTCDSTANCVSSFDDRPTFFVAPWEFPGKLPAAVQDLKSVLTKAGASIEEQKERYLHAVFKSNDGIMDDVEFLFSNPREDAVVVLRSASRATKLEDKKRNRNRLEDIRRTLAWEQVPILRNRQRTFFFLESPWDSFGPEPPPSYDYKQNLQQGSD